MRQDQLLKIDGGESEGVPGLQRPASAPHEQLICTYELLSDVVCVAVLFVSCDSGPVEGHPSGAY